MRHATLELVRQFLHCKPFSPFRIVMRSGERHEIVDPVKVAVGKSKVMTLTPRLKELAESEIELVYQPRRARGI
ncbi:MAG TPA: hypothetical protein VIM11_00460 [Tepidisphaeraceae bacterium]|jgi:hypothetical protein